MPKTAIQIGPQDHGRCMSLEEFDHIDVQPGYIYELGRGVIVVSDVPRPRHFVQVDAARMQIAAYSLANPGRIFGIAGGGECKLMIPVLESERHPDLGIYLHPPQTQERVWWTWVPALVVEVVSPRSEQRDYEEKPAEYFQFGVSEYWILDAARHEMKILRRARGRIAERVVRPPQTCRTRLLPGLEFDCAKVFEAADAVGR